MDLGIFCMVAMTLSVATLVFAILVGIKSYRSEFVGKGDALYKKHFVLTPFQIFLICFFLGTVYLFVPIYYTDYFAQEMPFARVFKSIFLSIHNTMRLFILDGDFDIIENAVTNPQRVHYAIGNAYSIYAAFLFVIAPVMTASFVLSFFKNISSYVKYYCNISKKIYYISELNEKSIALATNILAESGVRKPLIAFFDVFENTEEADSELIDQAKRLGAVCFRKDITEIGLKCFIVKPERRFYFIAEDEDENIKQALTLIKYCRSDQNYNVPDTQFYVFSTTTDSEALLDSVDNGNMKVRRVNENKNLIISTLLENPIFNSYIETNGSKRISVLIVGGGSYGIELVKAIAWCGQIPDYEIDIHVVDINDDMESRLSNIAPEFALMNGIRQEGEPYYNISFHPGIDVYGNDFVKLLLEIGDVTTVFVTLGDDEKNVDVAMKVRREYGRLNIKKNYNIPEIYSVVYSTLKTQTFIENGGLLCLGEKNYNIHFIGDIRTRYSLEIIEQQKLEALGLQIHLQWLEHERAEIIKSNQDDTQINQKIELYKGYYEKYEYYRRTSIATAIYIEVLNNVGVVFQSDAQSDESEHKRWNAYMRTEGYVYDPDVKDHIAKTHPKLKPYSELSHDTRLKDDVTRTVRKTKDEQ